MSDIILRIPKDQLDHFWNDKGRARFAFWRFARRPKDLAAGDYVFFTNKKGVIAGARVHSVTDERLESADPQGKWKVLFEGSAIRRVDPAGVCVQSPQRGFRYLTSRESKILRTAYEEGGEE